MTKSTWPKELISRPLPSPVLVTGATSGIGAAVVEELLRRGVRVVGIGRSAEKAEALRARCASSAGTLTMLLGDTSLMREAVGLAGKANAAAGKPFSAVIQCMGTLHVRSSVTAEGIEASFTVSFLSRFAVFENLTLAADVVVVNVGASESGNIPSFIRHELAEPKDIGQGMSAHGSAQLANDIWVASLARSGLRAWGYGPGAVDTDIRRDVPLIIRCLLAPFFAPWTRKPALAAEDIIRLLIDKGLPDTGGFASRHGIFTHNPFVLDRQRQDRLIDLSRAMLSQALQKSTTEAV
jgi:NAD(P)-dependent dehydrogenase (short-subunit alcohol dehydrogenase family)